MVQISSDVDPEQNIEDHQKIIPKFSGRKLFLLKKCNMEIFYS